MIDAIFSVIENKEQRSELSEFYEENKNRLYSIALSNLHNEADAEDAVQEVFSEIADKPEKFFGIPPESRPAYTNIMVKNISINMFNSKNKMLMERLEEENETGTVSLENDLFDKIAHDEVISFVNQLPASQRSVLMLHCYHKLPIDEISRRLNISLTAANKRLTLARRAIRKFIEERNNLL